jgi:hypothetical protein
MMVMMIMMMMWCRFLDIFHSSVLHPFIVILVLMVLLQFSGQGAITFYTVQIFKVGETDPPPKKKSSIGQGVCSGCLLRDLSLKSFFC